MGTNDLHGHIEATPLLGGYLKNLRHAREKDGAVLLVDAGDMFQGTLESNLGEGIAVLHAYKALRYDAAAIGNHEFDYGPVGAAATPEKAGDNPRGALAALAANASFPMLSANILLKETRNRFEIGRPSVLVTAGGIKIGLIGVSTAETLKTTASGNVKDLEMAPLAETIEREATRLRKEEGADLVVAMAHAGGVCKGYSGDFLKDDCEADGEIFHVAEKLPKGLVDAIVAGHTHKSVAEVVNGIPIIESFSYGKAFGRIDFTVDLTTGSPAKIVDAHLYPPHGLCSDVNASVETCDAGTYEGSPVERDADVTAAIAPDVEKAKGRREEPLGVVLEERVRRDHEHESEEGNLFTDLLKKAHPEVTIALMNGGGLRADLPSGPLNYGALYEAFPFDNKTGIAEISGADLLRILSAHFHEKGGVLSVSGIRVRATCDKGAVKVDVTYDNGKKVGDKDKIVILASDFMMTGGDSFWGPLTPPKYTIKDEIMRDTLEAELRKMKTIKPSSLLDPAHPRMSFPGVRPVRCKE